MALPRRIVLHVGMAKAGSTALQNVMADRQADLLAQGVLFPLSILRRTNPLDPARTPGHIDLIQQIDAAEETPLLAECAAAEGRAHTLFLSMENLFNISGDRSVEKLAGFLAGCEIHLLAVLREPQDWVASRYYEVVTSGNASEFRSADRYVEEILDSDALDYAARLDFLERTFAAASLRVFDYRDLSGAANIVRTFVDALGVDLPVPPAEAERRVNVSVSYPESLEAHRRLNVLVRRLPQLERFGFASRMKARYAELGAQGLLSPGGPGLSPATRRALAGAVASPCRAVSARHFGGRAFGPGPAWIEARPPAPDRIRIAQLQDFGFEVFLSEAQRAGPQRRTDSRFDFEAEEARRLRALYGEARVLLEYGTGGSTLLAASLPGKLVLAVEDDQNRALRLRLRLGGADLPSPVIVHDVGGADDATYAEAIWDEPFFRHPDVVLLQGRRRSTCLAAVAARITRPVVVLFHRYDKARHGKGPTPARMIGRMAEFHLRPRPRPAQDRPAERAPAPA